MSPTGNRIALVSSVGEDIIVYDTKTQDLISTIARTAYEPDSHTMRFNEDGTQLFTASVNKHARVYDVATGKTIRFFIGHTAKITCLDVRGDLIATGSKDTTVRLWNMEEKEAILTFGGHARPIVCLAISHQRDWIVSCSSYGVVYVWDRTGHVLHHFIKSVRDLCFIGQTHGIVFMSNSGFGFTAWNPNTPNKDLWISYDVHAHTARMAPSGEFVAFQTGDDVSMISLIDQERRGMDVFLTGEIGNSPVGLFMRNDGDRAITSRIWNWLRQI